MQIRSEDPSREKGYRLGSVQGDIDVDVDSEVDVDIDRYFVLG